MAPSRFWRLAAVAATALLLATSTDAAKKKGKAEEVTHKARGGRKTLWTTPFPRSAADSLRTYQVFFDIELDGEPAGRCEPHSPHATDT